MATLKAKKATPKKTPVLKKKNYTVSIKLDSNSFEVKVNAVSQEDANYLAFMHLFKNINKMPGFNTWKIFGETWSNKNYKEVIKRNK